MGNMGPSAVVEALHASPLVGTLLGSVDTIEDDARWEIGIAFTPEATAVTGDILDDVCGDAVRSDPPALTIVEYQPWEVSASVKCDAPSFTEGELNERGHRQLAKVLTRAVEMELWRGEKSQANAWPNNWLANSASYTDLSAGGARPLAYALADLQYGLARAYNDAGVIHASARLVSLWHSAQMIELADDGRFIDIFGNTILCGPGYDGSDDTGTVDATLTTEWAYATGPIGLRIGEVTIINEPVATVDHTTNQVAIHAECFAAAYWDNQAHLAIQVDLCTTAC